MKKIEAVFQPQKLDDVKNALGAIGILGATAIEAKGFGRQLGHAERFRGNNMDIGFVAKVMLTVVVKEADLEKTIEAIASHARTGAVGDGKIFVTNVERVVRIRTGELNETAL